MPTPTTVLQRRLYAVPPQVKAKLQEVRKGIWVVRVDCHPLRALGCGVDGVEADGDFAFEVAADCLQRQAEPLAGFLVLGTVIIMMAGASWVRLVGLNGVSSAVDKHVEIIRHNSGGYNETNVAHSILASVKSSGHHSDSMVS